MPSPKSTRTAIT